MGACSHTSVDLLPPAAAALWLCAELKDKMSCSTCSRKCRTSSSRRRAVSRSLSFACATSAVIVRLSASSSSNLPAHSPWRMSAGRLQAGACEQWRTSSQTRRGTALASPACSASASVGALTPSTSPAGRAPSRHRRCRPLAPQPRAAAPCFSPCAYPAALSTVLKHTDPVSLS